MNQLSLKSANYFLMFGILFLNINSCKKDQNSVIPDVPVSLTINLNILNDLTIPGNSRYFPNFGYGGIIVYCELPDSYYAFDATCTYEVESRCRVRNEGVEGTCECCGSEFILLGGGFPSKGPAIIALKSYKVTFLNSFTLMVYN